MGMRNGKNGRRVGIVWRGSIVGGDKRKGSSDGGEGRHVAELGRVRESSGGGRAERGKKKQSLLPLYRGATPVQRALKDRVKETGVISSIYRTSSERWTCYCVRIPICHSSEVSSFRSEERNESKATLAPKITLEESWLSFDQEAITLHNKGAADDVVDYSLFSREAALGALQTKPVTNGSENESVAEITTKDTFELRPDVPGNSRNSLDSRLEKSKKPNKTEMSRMTA
ncbi:hypothetical protein ACH5RR_011682 [Cinchona calisaya]|uniref:Uncharacterized protein n=1 Tax=Cinchona calisaya TaxID=153742 RepID=A0ABD3A5L8_9GENT